MLLLNAEKIAASLQRCTKFLGAVTPPPCRSVKTLACAAMATLGSLATAVPFNNGTVDSTVVVDANGTGDYTSLAAAANAFSAVTGGINANWTILINSDLTETASSTFGNTVAADRTVVIKPAPEVTPTVTFVHTDPNANGVDGGLIVGLTSVSTVDLKNTNSFVIDGSNTPGGTTRDLTLTNQVGSAANARVVHVIGGANGAVKNTNIINTCTYDQGIRGTYAILFSTFYNSATSQNHIPTDWTVENCHIESTESLLAQGIACTNEDNVALGNSQYGMVFKDNTILGRTRGIFLSSNADTEILNNTIRVNQTDTSLHSVGIFHNRTNGVGNYTMTIAGNTIDQLHTANVDSGGGITGLQLSGIPSGGPATYNVYNNMITGFSFSPTWTSSVNAFYRGIYCSASNTSYHIYHNSIHMPQAPLELANSVNVGAIISSSPHSNKQFFLKNNIVNYLHSGGSVLSLHANILESNFNVFGTQSTSLFGQSIYGSNASLAAWTVATGQDANSIAGFDPFASAGSSWAAPDDLHFSPANVRPEGLIAGTGIAAVGSDIDGHTRHNTAPFPGCDELLELWPNAPTDVSVNKEMDGTLKVAWTDNAPNEDGYKIMRSVNGSAAVEVADLAADTTSYVDADVNLCSTYSYVVVAHNSDGDSPSTSISYNNGTAPTITIIGDNPATVARYGTYTDAGATAVDACGNDITADIEVTDNVNINSVGTYQVNYTVTDANGTVGTAVRTVNVVLDDQPENARPFDASTEDGVVTVGPGEMYSTLAAAANAFSAVTGGINANWTILINSDLTETASSTFGNTVAADKTVTLRPAAGVSPTVNFAISAANTNGINGGIIIGATGTATTEQLRNTDRFIIDGSNTPGGASRDLTLITASQAAFGDRVVKVVGGQYGVIKNLTIVSNSIHPTDQSFGIDLTTRVNAAGTQFYVPENWTIQNCHITATTSKVSQGIGCTDEIPDVEPNVQQNIVIEGNTIDATTRGIFLNCNANTTVTNNNIKLNQFNNGFYSIGIFHVSSNQTDGWTVNISGNVIDQLITRDATISSTARTGIGGIRLLGGRGTYNVYNNSISGFAFAGSSDSPTISYMRGIECEMHSNASAANSTHLNIFHNSIHIPTVPAYVSQGVASRLSAISIINVPVTGSGSTCAIKNNVIKYDHTFGHVYNLDYTPASFSIDYNVYHFSPSIAFANAPPTFSAWNSVGRDLNSMESYNPLTSAGSAWVSATDHHFSPDNVFPVGLIAGTPIPGVTTDIDGQTRSATAPMPGCDELINISPTAPTDLLISKVNNDLSITWTDSSNEVGYWVDRSVNGGDAVRVASLSADSTSYLDEDVNLCSTYSYTIIAHNVHGFAPSTAATYDNGEIPTITILGENPVTVEQFSTYTDAGATAVDACGNDITDDITASDNIDVNTVGEYQVTYTVTDANGKQDTEVRTVNVVLGPVTAPTDIAVAASGSGLTITWTDNANNETGYRVMRSVNGAAAAQVADLAAGSTSYTDTDVNVCSTYIYTVVAYHDEDDASASSAPYDNGQVPVITITGDNPATVEQFSSYVDAGATAVDACGNDITGDVEASGEVDTDTVGAYQITYTVTDANGKQDTEVRTVNVVLGPVAAPTDVAVAASGTDLTVTWTDNANNETGYRVMRSANGAAAAQVADLAAGSTSYTDTDVNVCSTYVYTVVAFHGEGEASASSAPFDNGQLPTVTLLGDAVVTIEVDSTYTDAGATAADACGNALTPVATGTVDTATVGTYTITYTATDANGKQQTATRTVHVEDTNVVKADQTITFGALANKTYGDSPITLTATASSGLPVSYSVSGPATVSGSVLTITGAGSVTVTASQAGNKSYNPAPDAERTFTVAKAKASISVIGYNGTYDGQPHTATGTASGIEAEPVDLSSLLTINGSFTDVPGGTATWSFAGNDNYHPASGTVKIIIRSYSPLRPKPPVRP